MLFQRTQVDPAIDQVGLPGPSPKKLRSSATVRVAAQILPPTCVICKRDKYKNKRKLPLTKAETLHAGRVFDILCTCTPGLHTCKCISIHM